MPLKKDKKWLLKNGDHIIGPFTEKEIKKELKKKYLSPFVCACVPGQEFWGFLAGYEEFKKEYAEYTGISSVGQFIKTLNAGSLVIDESSVVGSPVAESPVVESPVAESPVEGGPTTSIEEGLSAEKSSMEKSSMEKRTGEKSHAEKRTKEKRAGGKRAGEKSQQLEKLSPSQKLRSQNETKDHVLIVISVLLILLSIIILHLKYNPFTYHSKKLRLKPLGPVAYLAR